MSFSFFYSGFFVFWIIDISYGFIDMYGGFFEVWNQSS